MQDWGLIHTGWLIDLWLLNGSLVYIQLFLKEALIIPKVYHFLNTIGL